MMRTIKWLIAAAFITVPSWGSIPAHPGMLNYVEGQAEIDGQPVTNKSVGTADVEQGQVLETGKGKAEILLTPGVFLRLGDHSAMRMENPSLTKTSVEILRGEALVEATDLHKANDIQVVDHGVTTTLDKNGLYSFKADQPEVAVYDGKATVDDGDKHQDLKKGKYVELADLKTQKFDTKKGDELYSWSDLRSEYLSEASVSSARTYVDGGLGWYGGGWYWNPWYSFYSYLPGDGFLYSPFGWGFYAPWAIGYYHGPYYRSGGTVGVSRGFVGSGRAVSAPHAFAAPAGGGFRGAGGGFRGAGGGRR